MRFTRTIITDPDGNTHDNPRYVSRSHVNLKRAHAPFLFGGALLFFIAATFIYYHDYQFRAAALLTKGKVTDIESKVERDAQNKSRQKTLYRSIITFTAPDGVTYKIAGKVWSSSRPQTGTSVDILYNPSAPQDAVIDSFFERFGLLFVCLLLGLMLLVMATIARVLNPGQYSTLNIDGKEWSSTSGRIPHRVSRTDLDISFGKDD